MQLKQAKSIVLVKLTKPEEKIIAKATELVEMIAKIPCAQQAEAAEAQAALEALTVQLGSDGPAE